MNQIPKIEEKKYPSHKELDMEKYLRIVKSGSFDSMFNYGFDVGKAELHQQLQKARQDWLQEEIVKLEGMKVTKAELDKATYSNGNSVERPEIKQLMEWVNHRTLQSIIDRYHSELEPLPDRPLNQERE